MRTCNCTGYLTNPGGRCCMDMQPEVTRRPSFYGTPTEIQRGPSEERVREIIREELRRAKGDA